MYDSGISNNDKVNTGITDINVKNSETINNAEENADIINIEAAEENAVKEEVIPNEINAVNDYSGKLSSALKKELRHIFIYVLIGVCILILVIYILNLFTGIPEYLKFDYTVILGAVFGGGVAFLNFFLMGLTVQKVASDTNKERAASRMKMSYTYRYLMQIAWIVTAILVPCFNSIAGIVPLLFPTLGIKIAAIIFKKY